MAAEYKAWIKPSKCWLIPHLLFLKSWFVDSRGCLRIAVSVVRVVEKNQEQFRKSSEEKDAPSNLLYHTSVRTNRALCLLHNCQEQQSATVINSDFQMGWCVNERKCFGAVVCLLLYVYVCEVNRENKRVCVCACVCVSERERGTATMMDSFSAEDAVVKTDKSYKSILLSPEISHDLYQTRVDFPFRRRKW